MILNLEKDTHFYEKRITDILNKKISHADIFKKNNRSLLNSSAVFLLTGTRYNKKKSAQELCLILNKRSIAVSQPGDLCCPGGSISTYLDPVIANFLKLPAFPVARWKYWNTWCKEWPHNARKLAIIFAASLRESFEEMRLNPFGVKLLGALPMEYLALSDRFLYPVVGWVSKQKRFFPNWEVDEIIYIPVKRLLDHENYGKFSIERLPNINKKLTKKNKYYSCFIHQEENNKELLWGATYRIVICFIKTVFGFEPPASKSLPLIAAKFHKTYPNACSTRKTKNINCF